MAAGQAPNSSNIQRVAAGVANSTGIVVHPEYIYWRPDWQKLRDVIAGSREIKRKTELYLRRMPGQDDAAYARYLERAVYYNMTAQTQTGMLGQVFRRDPVIKGLPPKFKDTVVAGFAKDGSGHVNFTKTVMSEALAMGRYGVLVDIDSQPAQLAKSFAVGYATENILDWTVEDVNGSYQLTRVLLREFERKVSNAANQQNPWIGARNPSSPRGRAQTASVQTAATSRAGRQQGFVKSSQYIEAYTYTTIYRELLLVQDEDTGNWTYIQNVYEEDPQTSPRQTFTPNVRGTNLNFIPFMFFGASSNGADVEKPPLLDIADLNISHYRTYADLEHGRIYTALPVYYAPTKDDEGAGEYHIGPDMVWETPADSPPPGIIEFHGTGLRALETALNTKEQQIAAIGGRLMAGAKSSESPNQTILREANEQSLLLNAITATDAGMREVVRWWLMWRDVPLAQSGATRYLINRAFLSSPVGARELRAMQMMYDDGVVPVEIFYTYLLKAEVLDADVSEEDFVSMLENPNSFVNVPDASARQRGYSSRQQELDQVSVAREADMQQQEIELQEREVVLMENAPPPLPPKAPNPAGAALPARAGGPVPPRPGNGGKTTKAKKPNPGGSGGGNV